MWEVAALAALSQGYAPSEVLLSSLSPNAPCRYASHRAQVRMLDGKEETSWNAYAAGA